ncbi:hypothetical protein PMZ80_001177 [Knufia obscura]|uniref:C2H2-type domain-containing protein n=2 Tax=Knufia TaxID=430999 RepID=A0AAN8I9E7_9EURO|nr:hypothetical protein PMZ80_001177 [Knufia obscura]KAK5958759.1 hypothetical protein OHC33_000602 [Knufia fluminis]
MSANEDVITLYQDFNDTYDWFVGNEQISVSRSIAHEVLCNLDQSDRVFLQFVNHYPRFFNRPSVTAPQNFDIDLHIRVLNYLLTKGGSEAQPALLAFLAEVGLKIGFEVNELSCGVAGRQRLYRQPRLIQFVRQIPRLGNPKICKVADAGTWFACRLGGCQKSYLRLKSIEKHLVDDHKYSHTEVYEVFQEPENTAEGLQKRFGPFDPDELQSTGFDVSTLQPKRVPKRKRSQQEVKVEGTLKNENWETV